MSELIQQENDMADARIHWKKAFNKDYLGAHDLDEGQELKLVIKSVEHRTVKSPTGEADTCNVAIFADQNIKPMILNATACKQIQRFTGRKYIDEWVSVPIQVYVQENVRAFGEVVDALRIRDVQPRMEKPVLNKKNPKWNDAVKSYKEAEDKAAKLDAIRKHYELSDADYEALKKDAT